MFRSSNSVKKQLRLLVAVIGAAALLVPATASASPPPDAFIPQGLLQAADASPTQVFHVIVVGTPGNNAAVLKNEKLKDPLGNVFGHVRKNFKVLDGVAVDLKGHELLKLAEKTGIRSITPDAPVKPSGFDPVELWPLAVGAPSLWGTTDPATGGFTPGPRPRRSRSSTPASKQDGWPISADASWRVSTSRHLIRTPRATTTATAPS